ncbi:MAG: LysR family transcriptional regulator [Firmicutes bacterium]|nr:LysR family transcriptional regulator [Bacillota bacterium]
MIDHRLETFVTLARLKSYTKTAKHLNLTQPAVTQHIQYLEQYYGAQLICRARKDMHLTPEGELLLDYAQKVLALSTGLKRSIANSTGLVKGYRIGATLTIGEYVLPEILIAHRRSHPNIDISMTVHNTETILRQLDVDDIDLGVVEGPFNRSKYRHRLLKRDSLVLVVPPNHPLAVRDAVTFEDLFPEKLIIRERGSGTRWVLENALVTQGYSLQDFASYVEIGNLNAIRTLVMANLGITVISREVVARELKNQTLCAIPIMDTNLEREFQFVYLDNHADSQFITGFMDYCIQQVDPSSPRGK